MIDAGIDECGVTILRNEVNGVEQRSYVIGIDRRNAVFKVDDARRLVDHLRYPLKGERAMVETGNIEYQRSSEPAC